jgi:DNA-binding NtrC family response regulator
MLESFRILIVDDELIVRESLLDWLRDEGFEVDALDNGRKVLDRIENGEEWDAYLIDLKMPGMNGIEVMDRIHEIDREVPVIIMTAYATVDTAVTAMKKGAYDYIVKPFNPEEIGLTMRKLIQHQDLIQENRYLRNELRKRYSFKDLIGKSPGMQRVFTLVRTVAKSNSTILIEGESGTGKELVARAIHSSSQRNKMPFIAVSCAALPESLLESELYGHEKGAFTGAVSTKAGKFELADEGTLFLDEIGEISSKIQVNLLRVLEEKKFQRVGGTKDVSVDVRIITATNRDLKKMTEEGGFREDLYYRLNVISIVLPPLRERTEDIPLLVDHFLKKYAIENHKEPMQVSAEAMKMLLRYRWPGNVRELENCIERAVVISRDSLVTPALLPESIGEPRTPVGETATGTRSLKEIEKRYIRKILEDNDWNIKRSAEILGIDRSGLYKKMKRYGLRSESSR